MLLKPGDHAVAYVDDLLHGVLGERDAAEVRAHCRQCPVCEVALREAERRYAAMRAVPPIEPSERLVADTLRDVRLRSARREWTKQRAMSWAGLALATCVLLAGAVHLYLATLKPTPYDLAVLWQPELWAGTDASLRTRLTREDTGEPVERAGVRIELRDPAKGEWVHLASFDTDAAGGGSPRMRLPDWAAGDYEMRVLADVRGDREVLRQTVKLKRSWRLMLSTDKPVYQPGQTLRLRGLALRKPDLKPVAGQEAVFTVADPKGNVLFKQRAVTSRFGLSSADCPLDAEVPDGAYAVECRLGDTVSKQTVEVKRYVLPKFRLDVRLDKPYYGPDDAVRGTVHLEYFFGKPVAGAAVRVQPHGVPGRLEPLDVTAGPDGRAEFAFRLPGTRHATVGSPFNDRLVLDLSARDTAGQELKRTVTAVVTSEPLAVEVIPEAGTLVRGTANVVYVLARYADGRPAKVRLAVAGRADEIATSDLGVATLSLTPHGETVDLTLRATDDGGLTVNKTVSLRCGSDLEAFAVRADKAVYAAGETMTLTPLGGGGGIDPILVDLVKDGQTLLTQALAPGKPHAVDLPPDVFGTIQLTAYRFIAGGVPVRRSQAIYVRPPDAVKVSARMDKDEYRPGERATLNVSLTDAAGKPVAGAVSLSAVDEAVFSVLDAAPGMERAFFTLEQELLKPVYAIYDWSPDAADPAETAEREARELLNKALFARTAGAPSGGASAEAARLVAGADLDPRVLDALNRPDAERLLADSGVDDALRARILAMRGSGVTVATSYPEKASRVEQLRRRGGEVMGGVWVGLGVAAVIFVLILLSSHVRALLVLILLGALLSSILMPSLNRARETANRVKAASDLRQIGQAMQLAPGAATPKPFADPAEAAPRLRQWFPETLLWRPELITDDAGRASLDFDLADTITTWRLSASAVTAGGQLGAVRSPIRVFQPFFVDLDLPVALVRGDEVAVPVAVYNYLDRPQTVELALAAGPWFELLDGPAKRVTLAKGEVRSVSYRVRAAKVGAHALTVTARGDGGVADAVKRAVEVVPDGRKVEAVWNGTLQGPAAVRLAVPADAVEGSAKAFVKIYPSSFSQLVEGIDGIFKMPHGCFEQTSSTTYPNVLALDYLRRTKKNAPEVEARARQYIHLGYQRLVGFEVAGGGFDWFGRPPANRVLTAYGLMEFEDMARVHEVDPRLIARTRAWLLGQRSPDGWWGPEGHAMHDDPTAPGAYAEQFLSTTAYAAGAVFANGNAAAESAPTRDYLLRHPADRIADPYVLALVATALSEIDKSAAEPYTRRLDAIKRTSADGKLVWWERPAGRRTVFHGAGQSGAVETTALAATAALRHGGMAATARGALAWLVAQKDASGTWHSTQATVLALRALLAGTGAPLGRGQERRVELTVDGGERKELVIPADQDEVMKQVDVSEYLRPGRTASLELREPSGTAVGYQVSFRYHVPEAANPAAGGDGPLGIELAFDRTEVAVGQSVRATARVTNRRPQDAPMVIVDLPVPAGFSADEAGLAELRATRGVDKVQVTPRKLVVYLRALAAGRTLELTYRLRASAPADVTAPAAEVYEYYDPARRAATPPGKLTIEPGV